MKYPKRASGFITAANADKQTNTDDEFNRWGGHWAPNPIKIQCEPDGNQANNNNNNRSTDPNPLESDSVPFVGRSNANKLENHRGNAAFINCPCPMASTPTQPLKQPIKPLRWIHRWLNESQLDGQSATGKQVASKLISGLNETMASP